MIVLALDTALDCCSVAIADDGGVRAHLSENMKRGQAERIAPMAREAAEAAEVAFAEIARIVVTTGPGSFSGLRVGLAFARGLAVALKIPCLGVSTLEALALEMGAEGVRAGYVEISGASYGALYENGSALLAPARFSDVHEGARRFQAVAAGRPLIVRGPGGLRLAGVIGARGEDAIACDAALLAARARTLDPSRYPPTPLYLRAALGERA